ncbi:MAG: DUF99 family protein [Methanomassiliicoccales archaeon]|jgi:endonuclease V-like protein UPF0215 family|nr:DUF99 family protein [Methanomassiliicoccales archaeon]
MKDQVRVMGIDDSPFKFDSGRVIVVGVIVRAPSYLEGVIRSECHIDGTDANEAIEKMIMVSRFKEQIKLILVDGIALGGFNVIDISRIYDTTGIPCATITREAPDFEKMKKALSKHFSDWEKRFEIITRFIPKPISTSQKPIYIAVCGMDFDIASRIIRLCTVRGNLPEPIRIAHMIASAIVRGESKGRA